MPRPRDCHPRCMGCEMPRDMRHDRGTDIPIPWAQERDKLGQVRRLEFSHPLPVGITRNDQFVPLWPVILGRRSLLRSCWRFANAVGQRPTKAGRSDLFPGTSASRQKRPMARSEADRQQSALLSATRCWFHCAQKQSHALLMPPLGPITRFEATDTNGNSGSLTLGKVWSNSYLRSMRNGLRRPARGWWEKNWIEAETRRECRSRGIDPSIVGEATIVRHNGRPVWIMPIDLSGQDSVLIKLALF